MFIWKSGKSGKYENLENLESIIWTIWKILKTITSGIENQEKLEILESTFWKFGRKLEQLQHVKLEKMAELDFSTVSLCIWNLRVAFCGCDIELWVLNFKVIFLFGSRFCHIKYWLGQIGSISLDSIVQST